MKKKLKQLIKQLYKKQKQIKSPSPEINVIKNNRNNFGYPIGLNKQIIETNKPK